MSLMAVFVMSWGRATVVVVVVGRVVVMVVMA